MSKDLSVKAVKVTSKGQITIPIEIRESLGLDEGAYLEVSETDQEIRLRKILPARPIGPDDPIWTLIWEEDEARARTIIARDADMTYSYTDATSVTVMERRGLRLAFAFDPHFRQHGFQLVEA